MSFRSCAASFRYKLFDTLKKRKKFSLFSKLKGSHYVKRIGQVFDIRRSSYKYWQRRSKKPSLEQAQINSEVKAAFKVSNGSVGSRSIVKKLDFLAAGHLQ
jgi:hypothetical protein